MSQRVWTAFFFSTVSIYACGGDDDDAPTASASDAGHGDATTTAGSSSGRPASSSSSSGGALADGPVPTADDTYGQAVLADTPVGYWRLGDATGTTAKDEIGNAHPGTYWGGYQLGVPGITGANTASSFDGTTSYGDTGYPYFDSWRSEGTDNQYVMGAYSKASPENGKLVLNEWNHIVGTFDDQQESVWVNGVLRDRVRQSTLAHPNQGTFTIGCAGNGPGPVYLGAHGAIDEVAVYDKVLSDAQIAAHYAAGKPN